MLKVIFILWASLSISAQDARPVAMADIYYWHNMNLGFGHISMNLRTDDGKQFYLSWAMGNHYGVDKEKHQIDPEIISLKVFSRDSVKKFIEWYSCGDYCLKGNYGETYTLLDNNCAHAVQKGLQVLGLTNSDRGWALRPRELRDIASGISDQQEGNAGFWGPLVEYLFLGDGFFKN